MRIAGMRLGAREAEWDHFVDLGLGEYLYPVVCYPEAKIAPYSSLSKVGKIPSTYNPSGQVVGIQDWPKKLSTRQEIDSWKVTPDYGIAINCRQIRCFDVDVDDEVIAHNIRKYLEREIPGAVRTREGSSRFLLPFYVEGIFKKQVMFVNRLEPDDKIEFLANGQQFQACGLHVASKTKYVWEPSLPLSIPVITVEELQNIWHELNVKFGVGEPTQIVERLLERSTDGQQAQLDQLGKYLKGSKWYRGVTHNGDIMIHCPWKHEHTSDSGATETIYMPPSNGYEMGHFKCMHGHCEERSDEDYIEATGYYLALFNDTIPEQQTTDTGDVVNTNERGEKETSATNRFVYYTPKMFINRPRSQWIIKNMLPSGEVGVLFGPSGSGKSFLALDMMMAVAKGVDWNDNKVKQGRVVYVCAEGSGGFSQRVKAYCKDKSAPDEDMFHIIPAAPNITIKEEVAELTKAIKMGGDADVVVIDTLAQCMPGSNENSSEHVGAALGNLKLLSNATGAMVLLIHHAGKDTSKGARGWSGLRAACDCEIEVVRDIDRNTRAFRVSKMKDGRENETIGFELNEVFIDEDEDGDKITSCTIELTGNTTINPVTAQRERAKSDKQILVEKYVTNIVSVFSTQNLLSNNRPLMFTEITDAVFDEIGFTDRKDKARKIDMMRDAATSLEAREILGVDSDGKYYMKRLV